LLILGICQEFQKVHRLWWSFFANGAPTATTNSTAGGSSPLTAPVDYLKAAGQGQQKANKTVDLSALNQAIQLFNVDKGRNPKDLNELVTEKFLRQIPPAPYGTKIVYDAASGKVDIVKE